MYYFLKCIHRLQKTFNISSELSISHSLSFYNNTLTMTKYTTKKLLNGEILLSFFALVSFFVLPDNYKSNKMLLIIFIEVTQFKCINHFYKYYLECQKKTRHYGVLFGSPLMSMPFSWKRICYSHILVCCAIM